MGYIYQYDVMGFGALFLTQLCLYFGRHNRLKSHKHLIMVMILAGAVCFFDAVSGIMLASGNPTFYVATHVCTVLYFIALICFPYSAMNFFLMEMGEKVRKGIYHIVPMILCVILMAFNYPFKLFYSLSTDMVYAKGPFIYLIYPIYIIYTAVIYMGVRKHKRFLGRVRYVALEIIVLFSAVAAVVAYLRPEIPMAGGAISFGVAFACLIFYYVDDVRDEITARLNEKGFLRMADEKLHQHEGEAFVLRVIKIYNLNEVDERYGRKIGDEVIRKLSSRISDSVRGTYCAYGHIAEGKFAVLGPKANLPDVHGNFDLGDYLESDDPDFAYSFSIYSGDYPVREPGLSIQSMVDRADYARRQITGSYNDYTASFEGRLRRDYDRRNEIEGKVKNALANNEFMVYLQPIVETQSGNPVSAEALIRWRDSDGRLVPPGDFISVFEKNGFVTELDMFVLKEVCKTISGWKSAGIDPVPVSVNISRKDLQRTTLVDDIVSIVDSYNLEHSLIKIELTESAFVDDENIIKTTMDRLHAYDFKLLMDDFGSGYSNLNMFENLPVDIVKIDMRFLQNLDTSERGRIILGTVVDMTRKMGLETVVEGVENSYQYDYIHKLQCQMIQGFYFSKPMPISDFTQMLKKRVNN